MDEGDTQVNTTPLVWPQDSPDATVDGNVMLLEEVEDDGGEAWDFPNYLDSSSDEDSDSNNDGGSDGDDGDNNNNNNNDDDGDGDDDDDDNNNNDNNDDDDDNDDNFGLDFD